MANRVGVGVGVVRHKFEVGHKVRLTKGAWKRFSKGPICTGYAGRKEMQGTVKRLVGDWLIDVKWTNGARDSLLAEYCEEV